jgi:hypothetical protein
MGFPHETDAAAGKRTVVRPAVRMRVVLLSPDLLFGSRIAGIAESVGESVRRIDDPAVLPEPHLVDILLVDWIYRSPAWAQDLSTWRLRPPPALRPRVVLFGPHTDLAAHNEAKSAGLGPMWARSRILADLARLIAVSNRMA